MQTVSEGLPQPMAQGVTMYCGLAGGSETTTQASFGAMPGARRGYA
jgi:hypothetical protein